MVKLSTVGKWLLGRLAGTAAAPTPPLLATGGLFDVRVWVMRSSFFVGNDVDEDDDDEEVFEPVEENWDGSVS